MTPEWPPELRLACGINANVVHSWRQMARTQRFACTALTHTPTQFVPVVISSTAPSEAPVPQGVALVELAPLASAPLASAPLASAPLASTHLAPAPFVHSLIDVELHRGTTTLKPVWPAAPTAQLSAWTREVLA